MGRVIKFNRTRAYNKTPRIHTYISRCPRGRTARPAYVIVFRAVSATCSFGRANDICCQIRARQRLSPCTRSASGQRRFLGKVRKPFLPHPRNVVPYRSKFNLIDKSCILSVEYMLKNIVTICCPWQRTTVSGNGNEFNNSSRGNGSIALITTVQLQDSGGGFQTSVIESTAETKFRFN